MQVSLLLLTIHKKLPQPLETYLCFEYLTAYITVQCLYIYIYIVCVIVHASSIDYNASIQTAVLLI